MCHTNRYIAKRFNPVRHQRLAQLSGVSGSRKIERRCCMSSSVRTCLFMLIMHILLTGRPPRSSNRKLARRLSPPVRYILQAVSRPVHTWAQAAFFGLYRNIVGNTGGERRLRRAKYCLQAGRNPPPAYSNTVWSHMSVRLLEPSLSDIDDCQGFPAIAPSCTVPEPTVLPGATRPGYVRQTSVGACIFCAPTSQARTLKGSRTSAYVDSAASTAATSSACSLLAHYPIDSQDGRRRNDKALATAPR